MWRTEHTAETSVRPHALWVTLRDLHTGAIKNETGDLFEMHGPYQVGTEISVTPAGQETFRSRIIELVEDERYADQIDHGTMTLTFRYILEPTAGGTRMTHELVIDGPDGDAMGPQFGPKISVGFPQAMAWLFETAGHGAGA
jgi:hypothetical protein